MTTTLPNVRHSAALTALVLGALAIGGCQAAFIGNFVVLAMTFGVFFGTLGLGRTRVPTAPRATTSAEQSQSDV